MALGRAVPPRGIVLLKQTQQLVVIQLFNAFTLLVTYIADDDRSLWARRCVKTSFGVGGAGVSHRVEPRLQSAKVDSILDCVVSSLSTLLCCSLWTSPVYSDSSHGRGAAMVVRVRVG